MIQIRDLNLLLNSSVETMKVFLLKLFSVLFLLKYLLFSGEEINFTRENIKPHGMNMCFTISDAINHEWVASNVFHLEQSVDLRQLVRGTEIIVDVDVSWERLQCGLSSDN
jgi:hypothetical protein